MQESVNNLLMHNEEVIDSCRDEPSPADYSYDEVIPLGSNIATEFTSIEFRTPIIFNQGEEEITKMACTRYGLTHIVNAQNSFVANQTNSTTELVNPKPIWVQYLALNRFAQKEGATMQSALSQFLDLGLFTGYARVDGIESMKTALLHGNLIYTGSKNGDWTSVRNDKVYKLRTDNAIVGHAFCIIGFNQNGWIAINSYGESNGYFTIPYELTDTLYTRYAVIDSRDKEAINNYKIKIMEDITIEDAKKFLERGYTNGERPKEYVTREEMWATLERIIVENNLV